MALGGPRRGHGRGHHVVPRTEPADARVEIGHTVYTPAVWAPPSTRMQAAAHGVGV